MAVKGMSQTTDQLLELLTRLVRKSPVAVRLLQALQVDQQSAETAGELAAFVFEDALPPLRLFREFALADGWSEEEVRQIEDAADAAAKFATRRSN